MNNQSDQLFVLKRIIDEKNRELEHAHRIIMEVQSKTASGKVVEFEYAYLPEQRYYNNSHGLDRIRQTLYASEDKYLNLMHTFAGYSESAALIHRNSSVSTDPSWENPWFPFVDAISLYGLIATYKPERYIEVGSGFSTKFARRAIDDFNLSTKIISIDPFPRDDIDAICDQVIRSKFENVGLEFFTNLTNRDIFFLDSSHRVVEGNDVVVFFMEVLPEFPAGLLYGVHDVFLPESDYPDTWRDRHYGEQYMLFSYLLGGADGDEIVLPCYYLSRRKHLLEPLTPLLNTSELIDIPHMVAGQAFWMRRGRQGG